VHLIRTAAEAARLLREPDEPFVREAVKVLDDPASLSLGALLHDIGKVGRGSHVPEGVAIAERALDRWEVTGQRRADVLFLVRDHLLLSDTATRRNLEDEDLVLHVSARVGDERRLALLYILTVADAVATGPAASTPWRMSLVRDLVAKVQRAFELGRMPRDRAARIESAEASLRAGLRRAGVDEHDQEEFISTLPPAYLLWARPEHAPVHLGLVLPPPGGESRIDVRTGRTDGTWTVSVGAADRLGLLASIAGALTLSGLSILTAEAFTTEGGVALDVFEVRGTFEDRVDEERWDRFRRLAGEALGGAIDLEERMRTLRGHSRSARAGIPVSVRVDQGASDAYTVVEVGAADRVGLLFDLAGTFARLDMDVHSARVATYGPRVIDAFYVTERSGAKLTDPARLTELDQALIAVVESGSSR